MEEVMPDGKFWNPLTGTYSTVHIPRIPHPVPTCTVCKTPTATTSALDGRDICVWCLPFYRRNQTPELAPVIT